MPYSSEHKQRSRTRILDSAARLFARRGFDAVAIDEVMREAGLTRGAFYTHFDSKSALYAEAIATAGLLNASRAQGDAERDNALPMAEMVAGYLSREHIELSDIPCPLAFLATDTALRDERARASYTRVFEGFVEAVESRLPAGDDRRSRALGIAALMIGGVALGRVVADAQLSEALMAAAREAIANLRAPG